VGPRAGLDRCRKSHPLPVLDPRTVQLVVSRYTDYATRPTKIYKTMVKPFVVYESETWSVSKMNKRRLIRRAENMKEGIWIRGRTRFVENKK
jgi:hypothetical protein